MRPTCRQTTWRVRSRRAERRRRRRHSTTKNDCFAICSIVTTTAFDQCATRRTRSTSPSPSVSCRFTTWSAACTLIYRSCSRKSRFSQNLHLGYRTWLAVLLSGNALASINVVALRQTRLVPGLVTVCGRVNHLGM